MTLALALALFPDAPADIVRVGTAVSVFGLRDTITGCYNVTLDGQTTQYNAQSVWEQGAVLFYTTGLDPQQTHSLIITNAGNDILAIGYINTTSVSGVSMQVLYVMCLLPGSPTAPFTVHLLPPVFQRVLSLG